MLDFRGVPSWKVTYLAVGKRKIIDSKKCVKFALEGTISGMSSIHLTKKKSEHENFNKSLRSLVK